MFIKTQFIDASTGDRAPVTINSEDIHALKPVRGIVGVDQWEATKVFWRDHNQAQRIIDVKYSTLTTLLGAVDAL